MPLNLKIEKTTGLLVPGGIAPPIARGPQDLTLQFLQDNVAGLLAGGAPIALKLYALDDTVTPLATFAAWTTVPAFVLYKATINPLATALGYMPTGTLFGRISYGADNVDTPLFHVLWGGSGEVTGAPVTPIVILESTGIFNPAFVELTGSAQALGSLNAFGSDVGRILQGIVAGERKDYQIRAGDDDEDLPGIVHPANFDAETNAVVFVQA